MRSDRSATRAVLVIAMLLASRVSAQQPDSLVHPASHGMGWGRETFVLTEVLELAPSTSGRPVLLDVVAWRGGAVHRLWMKADGGVATRTQSAHGEVQLLYGRLVSAWWDAQVGVRTDFSTSPSNTQWRGGAVVGLQGLAPGWFEVEPSVFVTTQGNVSFDLTASYDLFLTQRLVLQPRVESTASLRDESAFEIGRGLVSTSFGLRTRFEVRREFAPYLGVVWERRYGRTAEFARASGSDAGQAMFVAGVRLWR